MANEAIKYSIISLGAIIISASLIVWADKAYKAIKDCNKKIHEAATISVKGNKKNEVGPGNQENKSETGQKQNENSSGVEEKDKQKEKEKDKISDEKESANNV